MARTGASDPMALWVTDGPQAHCHCQLSIACNTSPRTQQLFLRPPQPRMTNTLLRCAAATCKVGGRKCHARRNNLWPIQRPAFQREARILPAAPGAGPRGEESCCRCFLYFCCERDACARGVDRITIFMVMRVCCERSAHVRAASIEFLWPCSIDRPNPIACVQAIYANNTKQCIDIEQSIYFP